jgi:hypothetical protein
LREGSAPRVAERTGAESKGPDVIVHVGKASQFLLIAPASVKCGAPFSLTLTVEDAYGNRVTNYTGPRHFSSTAGGAKLPKYYTFTAADRASTPSPA